MKLNPLARAVTLSALGAALALPAVTAQAAFVEDSKATLEARNFYMNRDFRREGAAQSKAEEWAQGFILKFESGFTEGTVGVGVDAYGFTGFKLDSGGGTAGTGLLPRGASGKAPSSYGELGGTFKARLSNSVLKAGTLMPKLPVVSSGDSRLLPQTFEGVAVNSKEIDNLSVDFGRLERVNFRNSTNNEPMMPWIGQNTGTNKEGYNSKSTRKHGRVSNKFDFAGLNYKWADTGLSTGYHFGKLHDVYKQHILNGVYTMQLGEGQSLKTDLRYAKTSESAKSGIDNKAISGMVTYALGYNTFGIGYQRMSGDTGYAYLAETDPYLVNYFQVRDFSAKDERSWQARYTFDFAGVGIPGLSLMTRYARGSNIYMGQGNSRGKEWERDTDIGYVFQDGPLKNLGVKWRNATVRSDISVRKVDENRLIVSYTLPLL